MFMTRLAIFASGSGTNAENISRFFKNHPDARVKLILTNKNDAGVILRSEKLGIPVKSLTGKIFMKQLKFLTT
jgi:phosphoribosylglycinamide formyltransferase-1